MASSMAQIFKKSAIISTINYKPLYNVVRNVWKMSTSRRRGKERNLAKMVRKEEKEYRDLYGTIKHRYLIKNDAENLTPRDFLRPYKPYTPPTNAREKVNNICEVVLGSNYESKDNLSREDKFALLNKCFQEFHHSVPNSQLSKIINIDDVINFYETPVKTSVPFDDLLKQDLPPNLYIQSDYVRFNPETDTLFKGISAFPHSSTIVTGLKTKKKYKGYRAEPPDSYWNRAIYKKVNAYK